jgi:hypothetical protein
MGDVQAEGQGKARQGRAMVSGRASGRACERGNAASGRAGLDVLSGLAGWRVGAGGSLLVANRVLGRGHQDRRRGRPGFSVVDTRVKGGAGRI